MSRMTVDLLCRCTGQTRRKREETKEQFLGRVTHLYCAEKEIRRVVSGARLTPYASVTMVTATSVHTPVENPHIEITYSLLPGPGAEETGHVHVSQSLENYGFPHSYLSSILQTRIL